MKIRSFFTAAAIAMTPGALPAEEAAQNVVPYCISLETRICELFVEFLQESPDYRIVPVEDRGRSGVKYLNVELEANWESNVDLEARVTWWGKSGSENLGMGVVLSNAPRSDRAYAHLITIAMSSSMIPLPKNQKIED